MSGTNDFVPFCNENTGTNLPSQASYIANPNLPIGNQPGIASSSFNNKALRQGTTIAAIVAQIAVDQLGVNMNDNQNSADHALPPALYAALTAAFKRQNPTLTTYLSGSGNHNLTYKFQIAAPSVNPTAGATYSDGTTTFTVKTTVTGTQLDASGNAAPANPSGTLSKVSGTGDATLTYYAYRAPLWIRVRMVGGGGGGAGSGTSAGTAATAGGNTTFGTSLLVANGGSPGSWGTGGLGGAGGSASLGTGPVGTAVAGKTAQTAPDTFGGTFFGLGSEGASSALGGGGPGGLGGAGGGAAQTNTGSGGGAGGGPKSASMQNAAGGGAGGYVDAIITANSSAYASTYAYQVGGAGSAGGAGPSGQAGGAGAAGQIQVEEHYQ